MLFRSNRLHIYQDLPGTYDAWDILPNYKDKELTLQITAPLALLRTDDRMAEFAATVATKKSRWTRIIRLFAADRLIEVENQVDWQETHKLAKAEFGVNVLTRELVCDTSAGFIRRETHRNTSWQQARFEVCSHKWCDLGETGAGVAFLNQGLYGVGVGGNHITLSLLRATMRPDITADRGRHLFCYQILPHAGDFVAAGINRKALELNQPLTRPALPAARPAGLQALLDDLAAAGDRLVLQAIKPAEDGRRVVVRLAECDGARGALTLHAPVQPVNLLEDAEGEPTARLAYRPFEILSFAVNLQDLQ